MRNFLFLLLVAGFFQACKNDINQENSEINNTNLKLEINYAKGFTINYLDNYKVLTISNPWPGADKNYSYALVEDLSSFSDRDKYDGVVQIPLRSIVVTSTTHIPSLEMLEVSEKLVGFPNLNYISSEVTRKRIDDGKVTELGKNEDINTEVLIDLSPDVVIGFGVDGTNTTFSTIQKTGIPVVYNGDWTENSPLGKAEWIKFFAAFFNKEELANSIFEKIESDYNKTKQLALEASNTPTVLSGAMYKDVWYLPQGDSWAAQFIEDANGSYLWKESEGSGSIALNLEAVLDQAQMANYWIGPGQFTSLNQMTDHHSVYGQFEAFRQKKVYSFTNNKGTTGGVLYYELAPNRPDLVLKDIVKILHPDLLKDHDLYFFSHLN